jgi:hypothetical protein
MVWIPPGCKLRAYEVSFPSNASVAISTPKSLWPEDWITGELFATRRKRENSVPTHALLVPLYSSNAAVSGIQIKTSADGPAASLPLYRTAIANEGVVDAFQLGLSAAFLEVGSPLVGLGLESSKLTMIAYHFNIEEQAQLLKRLGLGC